MEETEERGKGQPAKAQEDLAWYIIHTYSGHEYKVKRDLEHRIEALGLQDDISEVLVPTEEQMEIRESQKRTFKRRIFPGYIMVKMRRNISDEVWQTVRNTPGITGFVGVPDPETGKPTPIPDEEAGKIIKRAEAEAPTVRVSFRPGQTVRIIDGPFSDFMGTVEEINAQKGKVRILVSFFGRETPIELDFLQVERV